MTDETMSEKRAKYKQPGKTLAESLGIEVPDNAPGGQKIASAPSFQKRNGRHEWANDNEYQGFSDPDAYGRADG